MSDHPPHSVYFGHHEHDDIDAAGLPRTHHPHGPDPLSPTFGEGPDSLLSPTSPPTGLEAIHPAAVAAARELKAVHDARVQADQVATAPAPVPAPVPAPAPAPAPAPVSAPLPVPEIVVQPTAGPSDASPVTEYSHNHDPSAAENGYSGS
ncbi:hypothetical protein FRC06_010185, partial [Ceratobasidium sp. 370]